MKGPLSLLSVSFRDMVEPTFLQPQLTPAPVMAMLWLHVLDFPSRFLVSFLTLKLVFWSCFLNPFSSISFSVLSLLVYPSYRIWSSCNFTQLESMGLGASSLKVCAYSTSHEKQCVIISFCFSIFEFNYLHPLL